MTRILFVCHGNICRSPMAEAVLLHRLNEIGRTDISVASAATSTEEIGNPPHPGTRRVLQAACIPLMPHRAVQLTRADYAACDYLLGMDAQNVRNMLRIVGSDPEKKIYRLPDFTTHPRDIADPWYTNRFDDTLRDIFLGCDALLRALAE